MKLTPDFQFKHFSIRQIQNPQKVGTDSMLLGAWTRGNFEHILDVGTGTGMLALMMAQQNPGADIVAIEPHEASLSEAIFNFENSSYGKQILPLCTSLQEFKTQKKFDLILSNPPYFENSTLSKNQSKNRVRHTLDLDLADLYTCCARLLSVSGQLNLIFPSDMEATHCNMARQHNLYPHLILRTKKETGEFRRTLISYTFNNTVPVETAMIVKYADNTYSQEYIDLTKAFYGFDLESRPTR